MSAAEVSDRACVDLCTNRKGNNPKPYCTPPQIPPDLVSNSSTPFPSCPAVLEAVHPSQGGREVAVPVTGTSGSNCSVPFYLP